MRWSEEVELLQEEMRRVLQYFTWHAAWWDSQATQRKGVTPELAEGLAAYAERQASIRRQMLERCQTAWHDVESFVALGRLYVPYAVRVLKH